MPSFYIQFHSPGSSDTDQTGLRQSIRSLLPGATIVFEAAGYVVVDYASPEPPAVLRRNLTRIFGDKQNLRIDWV